MTELAVVAVDHVGVSVADLDRARAFRIDELGALDHGGFAWPVDLGVSHLCPDVTGIAGVRAGMQDVQWHHDVTESSGGIAAVCYGTTADGVLVELLESRSTEAFPSRCRLAFD